MGTGIGGRWKALAAAALVVVGSGWSATAGPTAAASVSVTNCGVETVYEAPPERVVTMNQHATELMLALGLEERMVGTAYIDDAILPEFAEAYAAIPVLSDEYPSREVLLAAEPDFVFGGFESAFADEAAGSREALAELGIASYLSQAYCADDAETLADVFADLRALGAIFGVEERAEAVVATMEAEVAAVAAALGPVAEPRRVFLYDSGDAAPYTAGCCGIVTDLLRLAGAENVFADASGSWTEVAWEEVVARDPQSIVLIEAAWSAADDKRAVLESLPALANVAAVREGAFATLPFSLTVPGVRSASAVRHFAEAFYPERMAVTVPSSATPVAPTSAGATPTVGRTTYPISVENCGVTNTFEAAKQRIVTVNQNATEILLALGLGDRMVGTAYLDDAILPELADAYDAIPVLAAEAPSMETLLGVEPDFVYGVDFGANWLEARAQLEDLGVATYLDSSYCSEEPVTLADIVRDVRDLGVILDAQPAAEALIADMEARVAAVQAAVGDEQAPRVLFYRHGEPPITACCCGIFGAAIGLAGGENVFADLQGWSGEATMEEVVARDPEIIVLLSAAWLDPEEARAALEANPALAGVTAVRNDAYVVVPFPNIMAGVRTPETVEMLARAFHPAAQP